MKNDLPVLEPEKFEEQVGYDNELMVEIIDLFLEESQKDLSEMNRSVANCNWDSLSKTAHTIKGSLASLHAAQARATAQELESAARDQEVDVSVRAYHQLVKDLRILEPRLRELRENVVGSSRRSALVERVHVPGAFESPVKLKLLSPSNSL